MTAAGLRWGLLRRIALRRRPGLRGRTLPDMARHRPLALWACLALCALPAPVLALDLQLPPSARETGSDRSAPDSFAVPIGAWDNGILPALTVEGTVERRAWRLRARGLVAATPDPDDRRRHYLNATDEGRALYESSAIAAVDISAETLAPLSPAERETLLSLLGKLG